MRQAVAMMPGQPEVNNCLGAVLNTQGRHQDALIYFREAAQLDPNYAAPIRNLATVSWLLGYPETAFDYTLKLTQLEPDVLQNWQMFVQSLGSTKPESASHEMLEQIERSFEVAGVDLQVVVKPIIRLLMKRQDFREIATMVAGAHLPKSMMPSPAADSTQSSRIASSSFC